MRWSYPFAGDDVATPILGAMGDRDRTFGGLAALGYDGVELWIRDPAAVDWSRLRHDLDVHGLALSVVGTGPMIVDDGLSLSDIDAAVRAETVRRIVETVRAAAPFTAQVAIGKPRGQVLGHPDALRWQIDGARRIVEAAHDAEVTVTFEPQNRSVVDNLNTAREAVEYTKRLGPRATVMIDTYHAQIDEPFPELAFVHAGSVLTHIHFADSNRLAPGGGSVRFLEHLAALDAIGYDGWASFEISQGTDSLTAADTALQHLRAVRRLLDAKLSPR